MAIKSSNQITFTEYKKISEIKEWYLATSEDSGVTTDTKGWTTDIQTINYTNKYLWNYEEVIYSIGSSDISDPVIIGVYGDPGSNLQVKYIASSIIPSIQNNDVSAWSDTVPVPTDSEKIYMTQKLSTDTYWSNPIQISAADGNGIASVTNQYFLTSGPELPKNPDWTDASIVTNLSPIEKYLWNREIITYTDGTSQIIDPAIIGVYGDSGKDGIDAVDFQIYSVDGFEFTDTHTTITLKTVASQKGELIENATYQWKWWNPELEVDDKYEIISNETTAELVVNKNDRYAYYSLKCEMAYGGIIYEDHITLTEKKSIYTASVQFIEGSNAISSDKDYLFAYIELYRDNQIIDSLKTNEIYYSKENSIKNGIVYTDISGNYTDGSLMYFIYQIIYDGGNVEYDSVLGEYKSGEWKVVEHTYVYKNNLYPHAVSHLIYIPKSKIFKSTDLNIEIVQNNIIIARTKSIVMDLGDPIIGSQPPSDPSVGQFWVDTSNSASVLKVWDGNAWVNSNYQDGGAVYTSQPQLGQYKSGDLWILAEGERYGEHGPGSILKADIDLNWVDAISDITTIIANVKESFTWNSSGIQVAKRVEDSNGNITNPFYVHIASERMGFHSVEYNNDGSIKEDVEVVHIGNNSSIIQNATFEGVNGTTFNNEAKFKQQLNLYKPNSITEGFTLKVEANGSFSIGVLE